MTYVVSTFPFGVNCPNFDSLVDIIKQSSNAGHIFPAFTIHFTYCTELINTRNGMSLRIIAFKGVDLALSHTILTYMKPRITKVDREMNREHYCAEYCDLGTTFSRSNRSNLQQR